MIWNPQPVLEDDALVSCVWSEIRRACSGEAARIGCEEQRELARAVAREAVREHAHAGVPTCYLMLLAARALWAVGESAAARRLVALMGEELQFSVSCADAAFQPDMPVRAWWRLCFLRAVRPSAAFESARGNAWVLDLSRALSSGHDYLELTVFRMINAVLDAIAPLWDRSKGRGVLALRNVDEAACMLLRRKRKERRAEALASEFRKTCSAKLRSLETVRGWEYHPDVLSLDW